MDICWYDGNIYIKKPWENPAANSGQQIKHMKFGWPRK
jgi:hypothetical protein